MDIKNKTVQEVADLITKLIKAGYSKEYISRIIK